MNIPCFAVIKKFGLVIEEFLRRTTFHELPEVLRYYKINNNNLLK